MTATIKTAKPAEKRSIQVISRDATTGQPTSIRIIKGKVTEEYAVASEPTADGIGYTLTKADGTVYHVELSPTMGHTCDCPGHEHHGHCKHVDGLTALAIREAQRPMLVCSPAVAKSKTDRPLCRACNGLGEVVFGRKLEVCWVCDGSGKW